jgi:hypothetical protein
MNDTINVREIVQSKLGEWDTMPEEVYDAIKEIVEAVVDKCCDKLKIQDEETEYALVKAESILKVKNQINYE